MEIFDLYDRDRRLTGKTMVRGEKGPRAYYHLIVDALFLNGKGETLLQRRAKDKEILPDIWSVTGGSVIAGEDSAQGIVREVQEEMGFTPDMAHGRVLQTYVRDGSDGVGYIRDTYLFFQDVPLSHMTLQREEVQDAMWILPEKIAADPRLWGDLTKMSFWKPVFPYLCLESMRVRIPRGVYRHYKGNRYEVQGLALHSETLEPMVIYKALYGPGETWTRPASMWQETVTLPDGRQVIRFEKEESPSA